MNVHDVTPSSKTMISMAKTSRVAIASTTPWCYISTVRERQGGSGERIRSKFEPVSFFN
jgi:hypothetical protein